MTSVLTLSDRIAGSLIGSAVGDALGAPCEGMHYQKILDEYGDFETFEELESVKAGWNPIGSVTDDSVLADLLIDAIIENDGVLDAHLFANQWKSFETPIENPDGESINRLNHMHWIERIPYMRNNLREIPKRELGHGEANATNAVMYIGPVGLLCAGDPNTAALMAADVTSVNQHGLPRDVAAGYAAGLAACFLRGETVDGVIATAVAYTRDFKQTREIELMLDLARKCSDCDEFIRRYYVDIIGPVLPYQDIEHLDTMHWRFADQPVCNSWNSSEILGPALATFLITGGKDARTAMLACAKLGRDADTIARCVGGLMGAWAGLDSIPAEWRSYVLARNRWLRIEEKGQALTDIVRRRAAKLIQQLEPVAGGA